MMVAAAIINMNSITKVKPKLVIDFLLYKLAYLSSGYNRTMYLV